MGTDRTVVNAARVSFEKEVSIFSDRDARLIYYLARHGHLSPFRHAVVQWEIRAPLMVARQHFKYCVGSQFEDGLAAEGFETTWNESSRRYVTESPVHYMPLEWRSAPDSKKQGSGGPLPDDAQQFMRHLLAKRVRQAEADYAAALELNVAPEQARLLLLGYGVFIRYRWTASLQAVCWFMRQRLNDDAQWEIQQYAQSMRDMLVRLYPNSVEALMALPTSSGV
jgi:thymidylate synthase (FAD)